MILNITPSHIHRANVARANGILSSHCCPTAQCLKEMGMEGLVGMTMIEIHGKVVDITDKKLLQQIENWTYNRGFEPGEYEI